jgi:hypothetical protein
MVVSIDLSTLPFYKRQARLSTCWVEGRCKGRRQKVVILPTSAVGVLCVSQSNNVTGWKCSVQTLQTCTENSHRLKDCTQFGKMDLRDRTVLMEHHELCIGCLTTDHGWTAKLSPYKEKRMPARSRRARPTITIFCTSTAAGKSKAEEDIRPVQEAAQEGEPAKK